MKNPNQELASTTLAFVGDAVFTLFIREKLAQKNLKPAQLTKIAGRAVSAVTQSDILEQIKDSLSEKEADIVRRCRNTHTNNKAKNASVSQYRRATGLEGLIGYLYLNKDPRLAEILNECLMHIEI